MKTEVAPLAVPGQQPQPHPNVGQTPAAAAATSGGAPVPNGAAGSGAVVPAGGCPLVAGAPGAAGSSSTGPMENLLISVPDLLTTVKQFVQPEKHEQLDQMLQRCMQKELGEQQVRSL